MRKCILLILTLPLIGQIIVKDGTKLEFSESVIATIENRHIIHTGEGKLSFKIANGNGPPPGYCGINGEDSAMIVLAQNGAFICLPDRVDKTKFKWMKINGTYTLWR